MAEELDLRDSGLLWLINRTVFHPRGHALGVTPAGELDLLGNGDQPWSFNLSDGREDHLYLQSLTTLAPNLDRHPRGARRVIIARSVVDIDG